MLLATETGREEAKTELYQAVRSVGERLMDAVSGLSEPILTIGVVIAVVVFIVNIGKGLLKAFEMFLIVLVGAFLLSHIREVYDFIAAVLFTNNPAG